VGGVIPNSSVHLRFLGYSRGSSTIVRHYKLFIYLKNYEKERKEKRNSIVQYSRNNRSNCATFSPRSTVATWNIL